jgi:uncharacterized membrane protein YGL010W
MPRKLLTDDLVVRYAASHRHRANQVCHMIGIPMIVGAMLLAVAGLWRIAVVGWVVGWSLQFIGHAFERKPPEFFRDWRFLFVGLRWWFAKVRGQVR